MEFIAKTLKGLEEVLAEELVRLGANDIEIQRRAVKFSGDKAFLYKANMHLRTALRILMPICNFRAKDPEEVYEKLKDFDWSKYMDVTQTFAIDSTVYSDNFSHSKYVTYKVKDALADHFRAKHDKRPNVSVQNPDLNFNFHISQRECTLSLDSSGESLYKRGYRDSQTEAPINEVLAAGMLLMAGWDGQCNLVDPMCGSGTFLIEGALIALNIPPGIYRQGFGFEKWKDFDQSLFDEIYQDDSDEREFNFKIFGSDISRKSIKIASDNIKGAGLAKYIELTQCSATELKRPAEDTCLVVTNPPYGERLTSDDIFDLYKGFGSVLKHQFQGCSAWVISSNEELLARIGMRPSKRYDLLNGSLECSYNRYDIFAGKMKEFKEDQNRGRRNSEER